MNKKSVICILLVLVLYVVLLFLIKSAAIRLVLSIIAAFISSFFARKLYDKKQ